MKHIYLILAFNTEIQIKRKIHFSMRSWKAQVALISRCNVLQETQIGQCRGAPDDIFSTWSILQTKTSGYSSQSIFNHFGSVFIFLFFIYYKELYQPILIYVFYQSNIAIFINNTVYHITELRIVLRIYVIDNQPKFSKWAFINILKTQYMDYNISLEQEKGSYSPKSDLKDIENRKVIHEKAEQNMGKPNPYGNFNNQQSKSEVIAENKEPPTGCMRLFRLDFYEQFFHVSQGDVLERIKLAFIPIKTEFIEQLNDNPDFYGPFWLLTTIIFLVSSTGNLSRYFYNWTKDAYIFKLQLVRYAVLVLYSFGFGVPTILYFVMKFLGATKPSLPQMICIYGYSFSCFIPIFLLCIIPVPVLQWLLIAYGMVNTSVFLIFNLKAYLSELELPKVYLTFGLIVGAQVALFLTFKLVFFKMVYEQIVE